MIEGARYFRWAAPGGRRGECCLTEQEARQSAVAKATHRRGAEPTPLEAGQVAALWRGLAAQGWRIEPVSPTASMPR